MGQLSSALRCGSAIIIYKTQCSFWVTTFCNFHLRIIKYYPQRLSEEDLSFYLWVEGLYALSACREDSKSVELPSSRASMCKSEDSLSLGLLFAESNLFTRAFPLDLSESMIVIWKELSSLAIIHTVDKSLLASKAATMEIPRGTVFGRPRLPIRCSW